MTRAIASRLGIVLAVTVGAAAACSSPMKPSPPPSEPPSPAPAPPTPAPPTPTGIVSDAALFRFVTQTVPFSTYALFPNLDAGADGILTASSAHQPLIRVRLNATAASVLQNGRLPAGATFPDGSIIFKEVLADARTTSVYAVMYRDRANANAGNGWLWAELRPTGDAEYSITNRGGACTGCHLLGRGPQNDSVRIFERQR